MSVLLPASVSVSLPLLATMCECVCEGVSMVDMCVCVSQLYKEAKLERHTNFLAREKAGARQHC